MTIDLHFSRFYRRKNLLRVSLADLQSRVEILKRCLDGPVQADLVNSTLFRVQTYVLEGSFEWQNREFNEADDAPSRKVDSRQRHDLVDRANKRRRKLNTRKNRTW